jgi:hypothetical protein
MLNKNDILGIGAGRKTKKIHVKAWSGEVLVRGVSAGEMDHIDALEFAFEKDMSVTSHLRAQVCAYLLANEDGSRMFADSDLDALNALPAAGLTTVYREGLKFNRRLPVEEAEKNSEPTPKGSSGTS